MSEPSENPFEPPSGAQASNAPSQATTTSSNLDAPNRGPGPVTSTADSSPAFSPPSAATSPANNSSSSIPQPNPQHERETVNDPGVIALRGMFPAYDDLILQSVLNSVGGNQERAIDTLLGMSDPDYRSEAPAQVTAPQPVQLTQEELDEQFARQLVLQEQQAQTEQWMQAHATGPGSRPPAVYPSNRPNAQQAWNSQTSPGQDRPSEFSEQINKFAETGKKTIGSIFSKVKAKLQEFEQGRPVSSAPASGSQQQQSWTPPSAAGASAYASPPQPQPQYQQPAYYDPDPPQQISPQVTPPARGPQAVQGYDVDSSVATPAPFAPASTTVEQLQRQPSPQPVTVPPPQIGSTLDGNKLGLLPKRPVTLLRDPNAPGSSSPKPPHNHDDDDDDLEYAENPFESESTGSGKK